MTPSIMRQYLIRKNIATAAIAAGTLLLLFILWETWRAGNLGFGDKTLWDWMELLIIPLVLAAGGLWFNYTQKQIELDRGRRQLEQDREIAKDRREQDLAIAQEQREQDLRISHERREQELVQTYFDRITSLLLEYKLRVKDEEISEEQIIARALTLAVLRNLTTERRDLVIQFLLEASLIQSGPENLYTPLISLRGVDLSGTDLRNAILTGADLRDVDLSGANLSHADLSRADLGIANLTETDLSWADLREATLIGATLRGANLRDADLRDADLIGVDLRDAYLWNAKVSQQSLRRGRALEGATLPDTFLDDPPSEIDDPPSQSAEP